MPRAGLYVVRCRWCAKDHPYLGEDMVICVCGAVTKIVEIDDGDGHTRCLTYSPEKSREMAESLYTHSHWRDDRPAGPA